MKHHPSKYLLDMLDACQYLIDHCASKSIEDYKRDRQFRSALQRELQNIGEALRQLHARDSAIAQRINDHEKIIRFRRVLVHGYDSVWPDYVRDVIEQKLPIPRRELKALIDQGFLFDKDS